MATYSVGLLQAKAYRILKQNTSLLLKPYELSTIDWALLGVLYEQENGVGPSEMAQILGVEAPFVTAMAESLEKKGFITRIQSSTDKRAKLVVLTKAGKNLVPKLESHLRKKSKHLIRGVSISELLAYRRVLKAIIENQVK